MFAQSALVAETGKLQKFAMRLTKNKSDADDLLQSTCLRALEKADMFENGTNLFGWTSKIMFNIFVGGFNRRKKFENKYDPEPYLAKMAEEPSQEIRAELGNVHRAMAKLSAEHRKILVLICIKGMEYSEVSRMLRIPIGTVRSRLCRAREQLKIIMAAPSPDTARLAAISLAPANANVPVITAFIASQALQKTS